MSEMKNNKIRKILPLILLIISLSACAKPAANNQEDCIISLK
jgi:hypothetical protein